MFWAIWRTLISSGRVSETDDVLSLLLVSFTEKSGKNPGTITTNQFRSILHSIALPVADDEIRVLAQRFGSSKGGVDRINYRAVAAAVSRGGEVIDADKTGKEMGAIGGEVGRVAVGW